MCIKPMTVYRKTVSHRLTVHTQILSTRTTRSKLQRPDCAILGNCIHISVHDQVIAEQLRCATCAYDAPEDDQSSPTQQDNSLVSSSVRTRNSCESFLRSPPSTLILSLMEHCSYVTRHGVACTAGTNQARVRPGLTYQDQWHILYSGCV
jgi:hypothetical protein